MILSLMGTRETAAVNGYDPVYAGTATDAAGDGLVINSPLPVESGRGVVAPVLFGADPVLQPAPAAPTAAPIVPSAQSPRVGMQPALGVDAAAAPGAPAPAAPLQLTISTAVIGVVLIVVVLAFARSNGK